MAIKKMQEKITSLASASSALVWCQGDGSFDNFLGVTQGRLLGVRDLPERVRHAPLNHFE